MKAEYIEFNGHWHKDCSKCKKAYGAESFEELKLFFTIDKRKSDGLDSACKDCKKQYRQNNKQKELHRWKRNYMPGSVNRQKHIIRSMTRRKFGSAKNQLCKHCNNPAEEWHHVVYQVDSVIALCQSCHEKE